jgi:hypothetical protein
MSEPLRLNERADGGLEISCAGLFSPPSGPIAEGLLLLVDDPLRWKYRTLSTVPSFHASSFSGSLTSSATSMPIQGPASNSTSPRYLILAVNLSAREGETTHSTPSVSVVPGALVLSSLSPSSSGGPVAVICGTGPADPDSVFS